MQSKFNSWSLGAIAGAFIFSLGAAAIDHPNGTLLEDLCGDLNKSQKVCWATVVGSKNQYLVIKHFLKGEVAIPAQSTANGLLTVVRGIAVPSDDKGVRGLETEYVLKIRTSPKATFGTWVVNEKQIGPEFVLEPVSHVQ